MANYQNLKAAISAAIRTNGNQEITGQVLQDVLNSIVSVIGANYTFAGVATPATNPGTPDQNVIYLAMEGGTYTNFNGTVLPAGISLLMWNGSWTSETVMYGDGGVFDISVYKSSGGTLATFADLAAALNGGNNIPVGVRKGGMSVKFVQSSDNKYIQARCMAQNFTTDVTQWAIDDAGVYVDNPEFIYVKTDKDDKILWAIKTDGSIYYGAGVPQQVVDYINEKIADLPLDEYEDIVAFLDGLEEGDKTLQTLLNEKVDKEEGKSLIDSEYASTKSNINNPEFLEVTLDSEDKIIEGIKSDGTKVIGADLQVLGSLDILGATYSLCKSPEWIKVLVDSQGRIIAGVRTDGSVYINKIEVDNLNLSSEALQALKAAIFDNLTLDDINNGTPNVYLKTKDVVGNISAHGGSYDATNDCLNFINANASDYWIYSNVFNPVGNKLIHIKFRLQQQGAENYPIKVCISKNTTDSPIEIKTITTNGDYDIKFDATYYRIYQGFTSSYYIWFFADDVIANAKIYNVDVFELGDDEVNSTNIEGVNAKELFESTDQCLSDIKTQLDGHSYLIAPNGSKYEIVVDNNGQVKALPTIPNKAAFFGNSLMFGHSNGVQSFGMSALSSDADFYSKFNAYVVSLNPNYNSTKSTIVPFERISNLADIDSIVTSEVNNLFGDENLVVIQGGDNISAELVENILPTSAPKLLQAIRTKCPNARVCWLATWYNTPQKYQTIADACKKCGCIIIPIYDLYTAENMGEIGQIIHYATIGTSIFTIENVTNLVENSPTNITFTFTYSSVTKTVTINVTEYSLDGTTLSYKGQEQVVTVGWSHPGNRGMKAIANRLLYNTGISDSEEAYNLD